VLVALGPVPGTDIWQKVEQVSDCHVSVFAALASGLSEAPIGAWRGELIMTAAVLCSVVHGVL
jgi:hypothetical protein